jgi:hypothetical protein
VEAAQEFNPTLVNSHSLKDYFTHQMAEDFFTQALAWQEEKGYRLAGNICKENLLQAFF